MGENTTDVPEMLGEGTPYSCRRLDAVRRSIIRGGSTRYHLSKFCTCLYSAMDGGVRHSRWWKCNWSSEDSVLIWFLFLVSCAQVHFFFQLRNFASVACAAELQSCIVARRSLEMGRDFLAPGDGRQKSYGVGIRPTLGESRLQRGNGDSAVGTPPESPGLHGGPSWIPVFIFPSS